MHPVTGVHTKSWAANPQGPNNVVTQRQDVWWYRQRKPYNIPLAYLAQKNKNNVRFIPRDELASSGSVTSSYSSYWRPFVITDLSGGDPWLPFFSDLRSDALNKALERFNAKRGDMASLGVTMAETQKTTAMIERRARQTLSIVNSLRKMRLREAARQLGLSPGTVRKKARGLSGLQLEISFGWMPFIGDMYNAVKVLNAPIPYGVTRGAATISRDLIISETMAYAAHKVACRAYVAATLEVERPDLDLASRLGLTNPLGIVFELVPWSFVANWVINFEEYLAQFSDYPGVKVGQPHYGVKIVDEFSMWQSHWSSPGVATYAGSGHAESFQRSVGSLPSVKLGLRSSIGLGFTRALNAVSLLVQKGIRGR